MRGLGPGTPRLLLDPTQLTALQQASALPGREAAGAAEGGAEDETSLAPGAVASQDGQLTKAEKRKVADLERADAEIRRHEAAHAAAGGQYAGTPRFQFETGPDGQRYAVSGEVSIDVSPVPGDPRATIAKMQVVRRAANAPAEPSGQDRSVAAAATRTEATARAELAEQRAQQLSRGSGGEGATDAGAGAGADSDAGADTRGPSAGESASGSEESVNGTGSVRPGALTDIAARAYARAAETEPDAASAPADEPGVDDIAAAGPLFERLS